MGRARDVVEAAYRAWNAGDLDRILNDYDENAKYWSTARMAGVNGKGEIRKYCESQLRTFPTIRFVITNLIESGDSVAVEYRVHATHIGPLEAPSGTIPATGKTIDFAGADFFEIRSGKIVTERNYVDSLELMRQLGLMPARK
jgi:steroid delta-isomerase-like uncharacterized protein